MKRKTIVRPAPIAMMALTAALTWGCSNNDKDQLTTEQQQQRSVSAAQDNGQIILATQEMMDVTAGAFAEKGITDGRKLSERTDSCIPSVSGNFNLNTTFPDSLIYSGSVTVDYGDGSSCDSAHPRSGKITDTFVYALGTRGGKFVFSTKEDINFVAFKKDTVKFDGNVNLRSGSTIPTTVEAINAKMTYPDGTAAQWNGALAFEYVKMKTNRGWGGASISVTGSLNGTSREGTAFSAGISRAIVFRNTCPGLYRFIPLTGTIDITTNGVNSTLDYGDGSCDKTYTITSGGTTTVYVWDKK